MDVKMKDATSVALAKDLCALILAQERGDCRILLLDSVATMASIRASLLGLVRHGELIFYTTKKNWALARYLGPSSVPIQLGLAQPLRRRNAPYTESFLAGTL